MKAKECIGCGGACWARNTVTPRCKKCYEQHDRVGKLPKELYKREWNLKKNYGIDLGGFDILWIAFEGKCGICAVDLTLPESQLGQQLSSVCVDHDHKTGNIRGLLCNGCNKGIGLLKDDKELLLKAYKWVGGSNE